MGLRILKQDGPARIGENNIDKNKIKTPNILFIDNKRFRSPIFSEIILTNEKKQNNKPKIFFSKENRIYEDFLNDENNLLEIDDKEIYAIKYAKQLFTNPTKFVYEIIEKRKEIGPEKILYVPSIAEPKNLSLLTYLGIDLFDSTNAIVNARDKIMFFKNGNKKTKDMKENSCICPICIKSNKKPDEMDFEEILYHNYYILFSELKNIRNSIRNNSLRNLVEQRIKADSNLTTVLRIIDDKYYNYLEEKTPIKSKNTLYANSIESMNRPEIKRFQNRAINRYKKPESAKILLLLPCSKKKPYSFSKSHSFFKRTINSIKNQYVIHELIVTSPVGIVPRELELIYPACNYDIPVTGTWFEHEKQMINYLLKEYIKKNEYDFVISHLKKDMIDFIKKIVKIDYKTCVDHPTSKESLDLLKNTLNDITKKYDKVDRFKRVNEDVQSFASYHFGKKTAEKLLKNAKIKGRYPYQKIMKDNKQIGMIVKEKGKISLTLDGAKILFKEKKNIVNISDDFELVGSVFAPGIKNADEEIRIGDEVIVQKKNNLIAVGSAIMNGKDMKNLKFGEAVKIRHIKKN